MGDIITVADDLRIEVDTTSETPLLYIYSEGMRDDGETGVVVWPNEIRPLIDALATAAGLLAQGVADGIGSGQCIPLVE